jgi:hypothetical protein
MLRAHGLSHNLVTNNGGSGLNGTKSVGSLGVTMNVGVMLHYLLGLGGRSLKVQSEGFETNCLFRDEDCFVFSNASSE